MADGCNGGSSCKCGCEKGSCTCKQVKLEDIFSAVLSVVSFAPMPGLATLVFPYIENLIKFPFEVHKMTSLAGDKAQAWAIIARHGDSSPQGIEARERLDAIDIVEKVHAEQKKLEKRGDTIVSVASDISTSLSFLTQTIRWVSRCFDIVGGVVNLVSTIRDYLNRCNCLPCGEEDTPPPPGGPGGGKPGQTRYDPLAFDLNGDGRVTTINVDNSKVFIDVDNDQLGEKIGWVSGEDGIVFYDKNSNGKFDGLSELFGTSGKNGFEELATYDKNGDKVINAKDDIYSKLQIWQDLNSDGKIQEGER